MPAAGEAFDEVELRLITSALLEYAQACALGAELAAGRDESRRCDYLQQGRATQLLLQRIGCMA